MYHPKNRNGPTCKYKWAAPRRSCAPLPHPVRLGVVAHTVDDLTERAGAGNAAGVAAAIEPVVRRPVVAWGDIDRGRQNPHRGDGTTLAIFDLGDGASTTEKKGDGNKNQSNDAGHDDS